MVILVRESLLPATHCPYGSTPNSLLAGFHTSRNRSSVTSISCQSFLLLNGRKVKFGTCVPWWQTFACCHVWVLPWLSLVLLGSTFGPLGPGRHHLIPSCHVVLLWSWELNPFLGNFVFLHIKYTKNWIQFPEPSFSHLWTVDANGCACQYYMRSLFKDLAPCLDQN